MDAWDIIDIALELCELVAYVVIDNKKLFEQKERASTPRVILNLAFVVAILILVGYGVFQVCCDRSCP